MPVVQNHLIELLPRKERVRLLSICEPVELALEQVVCESGSPTFHVYFPTEGFISLLTLIDEHPSLEVGMVGREGMVGVQLTLGVLTAPLRALVQGLAGLCGSTTTLSGTSWPTALRCSVCSTATCTS